MSEAGPPPRPFPLGPLLGGGALLATVTALAVVGRLTGAAAPPPPSKVVLERDLRFADRPDGGLVATDARTGQVVTVMSAGTNGFLRATLHGLARARKREGFGPDPAFHLIAWADGRLTLDDPTTARRIELEAFGATNETAFARLLPAGRASP